MSGTSLDGVDIAHCRFDYNDKWEFSLISAETIPYPASWKDRLLRIPGGSALEISILDIEYGRYLGKLVADFCTKHRVLASHVSSHGHTIFHQPSAGYTRQIGHGAAIAAEAKLPVVCDFRTMDVMLGGSGAPLVPIGDRHLFSSYSHCLNLGGIANVSFEKEGRRIAYDICACNIMLNMLAGEAGLAFDEGGKLAAEGKADADLVWQLNALSYFGKLPPKSLGREDIEREMIPLLNSKTMSVQDRLSTVCEHISDQVAREIPGSSDTMLITGGGAYNDHLVRRIGEKTQAKIIKPSKNIIDFKEAIIFAFLGVLRLRGEVNCLSSVTGATADNCGGSIYQIKKEQ